MERLTLHVGTHKTGTTSLQRFVLANADLLAEQGLYVPKTPGKYRHRNEDRTACFLRYMAHNELFGYYPDEDFGSMALQDALVVTEALESRDDVLLSDERIWYDAARKPEYWKAIRNVSENLGFDSFRIVVYLRRQEDLAVSLWEQFAKQTIMRRSLNDYLKSKRAISVLDYHSVLKAMEDVFEHESIIVRVYDRNAFTGGDIFRDFCDALGLSWNDSFVIPENLNQSLTFYRSGNQAHRQQHADEQIL